EGHGIGEMKTLVSVAASRQSAANWFERLRHSSETPLRRMLVMRTAARQPHGRTVHSILRWQCRSALPWKISDWVATAPRRVLLSSKIPWNSIEPEHDSSP